MGVSEGSSLSLTRTRHLGISPESQGGLAEGGRAGEQGEEGNMKKKEGKKKGKGGKNPLWR